jgi:hypothetical protein
MGTVFHHRSPSLFLNPGQSGYHAPSLKGRALHHADWPNPSRVDDGRPISACARPHHGAGSPEPRVSAVSSPRHTIASPETILEYTEHYHEERNHQGLDNELIVPAKAAKGVGKVDRRERLGGLLNFYYRKTA